MGLLKAMLGGGEHNTPRGQEAEERRQRALDMSRSGSVGTLTERLAQAQVNKANRQQIEKALAERGIYGAEAQAWLDGAMGDYHGQGSGDPWVR